MLSSTIKVIVLLCLPAATFSMQVVLEASAAVQSGWSNVPPGAKVIIKDKIDLDACKPGGRWPKLGKFDLVISWWTGKNQSDYKTASNPEAAFMQSRLKARVQNQAEIMYSLRSYEKYGLLDHVNQVFILIDRDILSHYGAPRFFDYKNKNIHVISSADLGFNEGGQWEKLVGMHTIPGLSDYFVWLPDDVFMARPFDLNSFWSGLDRSPRVHDFGTYSPGWCDGEQPTGALHGPVLIQKCAMNAVMTRFFPGEDQHTVVLNAMRSKTPIDILCLYTRTMAKHWNMANDAYFFRECHTNGGAGACNLILNQTMFVNIQGNQVSDEYSQDDAMAPNAKELMPEGAAKFFESNFPTPSRFEKPDFSLDI